MSDVFVNNAWRRFSHFHCGDNGVEILSLKENFSFLFALRQFENQYQKVTIGSPPSSQWQCFSRINGWVPIALSKYRRKTSSYKYWRYDFDL